MKNILALLAVIFTASIQAQEVELPQYVNHMADNPFMVSPAYAGIGSGLQFRLNGVSQWIGVKDSPNTQSLSVEGRFTDVFAGGLTLFNDSNGATKQQGVKGSLAYHIILSDLYDSFLSFALTGSYTQFSIDTGSFINEQKQSLENISVGTTNFDMSMLYRFDRFALSVNVGNLLRKKIERVDTKEPEVLRKYSAYALYTFKINNDVEFEPSVYIDYFEASKRSKTDVNMKLRRKIRDGYIWGGLSYSFLNDQSGKPLGIAPMLGLKKNKIYFSYGVGLSINDLSNFNYGTHMITLGLDYDQRPSLARCTQKMMMF